MAAPFNRSIQIASHAGFGINAWLRGLAFCATLTVCLIDLVFLCFFVHYIRKSTRVSDTEPVSQRFLLISYYGVAANLVYITTFVMYLWRFVTMDGLVKSPVQEYMLDAVQYLLFTAAFVLLIALKLSLYHERPQDADESKPRSLRRSSSG
ncbi:hypothetical protein HDU78_003303 [Chytriomyces hyalinus]|nr:hypothetical protein HDU78_003303 [Chytriomyces hyalinus]